MRSYLVVLDRLIDSLVCAERTHRRLHCRPREFSEEVSVEPRRLFFRVKDEHDRSACCAPQFSTQWS